MLCGAAGGKIDGNWLRTSRHDHAGFGTQRRLPYGRAGQVRTATNHSGGIKGGITNGEDLVVRVGFKPVSTLMKPQASVNVDSEAIWMAKDGTTPASAPRGTDC